ncbi:MAG TPA: argininosuccinate lyase [Bacteroidales bacterium]|nr:argininosuccinate lyase [Bacteroidales bacterium]
MKLWEKDSKTLQNVMDFTIGNDKDYDVLLAPYDIIGSMAHAIMLGETGIMEKSESKAIIKVLSEYYPIVRKTAFKLNEDEEDIHSHLENYLVNKLGETGKKIHTGRSRNDQVMVSLQLFMKYELQEISQNAGNLAASILVRAKELKDVLLPGYTHTQVAMPSSVALWLGAYAESLANDLQFALGAMKNINQNPLGSAAGFGSSVPINRELTRDLLNFADLQVSAVSTQLNRGKLEMQMASGMASVASTLSRLASDMIFYMGQDLKFISFPDELTTGSSIMPHKKNPDVLELIRGHCNLILQIPASLNSLYTNLISGYHRDFQLCKQVLIPGINQLMQCLEMMQLMVNNMRVREEILFDEKYKYIFSVEEVNRKVTNGTSFRDAYREIAREIKENAYISSGDTEYTHTGSIGNPGLSQISEKLQEALQPFDLTSPDNLMNELRDFYNTLK